MIKHEEFRAWLKAETNYSKETISNIVSRIRRADDILPWFDEQLYLFKLEQELDSQVVSRFVRSQIKKAVKLYFNFVEQSSDWKMIKHKMRNTFNMLSLFANIGVAEAYLSDIGINVSVANEVIERRAKLYSEIYPETHMICGDITEQKVFDEVIRASLENRVNLIMATPPCQGMSTAGPKNDKDERNRLIIPVINAIKKIKPQYVFLENVPSFFNTKISIADLQILIPDLIKEELEDEYMISRYIIDTKDYSVPQTRERAIILMTQRAENLNEWILPHKEFKISTMEDVIGYLPKLDPFITDITTNELIEMFPHYFTRRETALAISKWHTPPHHVKRQVEAMQHTPTGCTAFNNEKYYPKKANGVAVKGFRNTYKRQRWDTAAYTITMDNRKISSQNNVHPGRLEYINEKGEGIYSDPRTLTVYEIMKLMSIPEAWPVPSNTSEAFLRRIIGEGIPPLFVKKVFENLILEFS